MMQKHDWFMWFISWWMFILLVVVNLIDISQTGIKAINVLLIFPTLIMFAGIIVGYEERKKES